MHFSDFVSTGVSQNGKRFLHTPVDKQGSHPLNFADIKSFITLNDKAVTMLISRAQTGSTKIRVFVFAVR